MPFISLVLVPSGLSGIAFTEVAVSQLDMFMSLTRAGVLLIEGRVSPQVLSSKCRRRALADQLPHGVTRLLTEHIHLALALAAGEAIGLVRLLNGTLPLCCKDLR